MEGREGERGRERGGRRGRERGEGREGVGGGETE